MERIKEPFIHITKREPMPLWKSLCIRFGAVLIALILGMSAGMNTLAAAGTAMLIWCVQTVVYSVRTMK